MRIVWLLLIALAGVMTGYLVTRFEGDAPVIRLPVGTTWVSGATAYELSVSDEGTGVERVHVWLDDGEQVHELALEDYAGNPMTGADLSVDRRLTVELDPKALGLADGPITLRVEARDFSWRGNVTEAEAELIVDTRAPRLSLATGLTYVVRGGAEMVVYGIAEPAARHGVELGEHFFPGYAHPNVPDRFMALYAYPPDTPAGVVPRVIAEDRAGNRSQVSATVQVLEKGFFTDTIQLSESFMAQKVSEILGSTNGSLVDSYLSINRDMRRENAEKLREICKDSNPDMLWSGAFKQMPNSATRKEIGYGVKRTYTVDGQEFDRQTHLGLDLASTARAIVPAANDGIIVFADELGIYGKTVVIDHGVGLFSLYAHLSEIGVAKGDLVSKDEPVGRTGTTGLAGGDHLHFGTMIHGVFVDPKEWLDGRWIREHIMAKLEKPSTPPPPSPPTP